MLIGSGQQRISTGFRPVRNRHPGEKQNCHGRPYCPPMTWRTSHSAQRVSETAADGEDREHFNEVRQRSWVLEGMRTIGVEEAATVGSELLNDLLRSDWALCNGLFGDGVHNGLAVAVDHGLAIRSDPLHLHRLD